MGLKDFQERQKAAAAARRERYERRNAEIHESHDAAMARIRERGDKRQAELRAEADSARAMATASRESMRATARLIRESRKLPRARFFALEVANGYLRFQKSAAWPADQASGRVALGSTLTPAEVAEAISMNGELIAREQYLVVEAPGFLSVVKVPTGVLLRWARRFADKVNASPGPIDDTPADQLDADFGDDDGPATAGS